MKKALAAALFALFVLPFGYLLLLSLASEWRFPQRWPVGLTLSHWAGLQSEGGRWWESALASFLLATLTALTSTLMGFVVARHLSAHRLRRTWLFLAYLPYAFSPVVYAHCLKYFFNVFELSATFQGLFMAHFCLVFPFAVLVFFNYFDHKIRDMESLVLTLGGSPSVAFWRLLVPVARPMLLVCFFQSFLISWFEYGLCSVVGLGQVRTLTIAVYQYIGEANHYVAALASCLLCLPPLLVLWFNQRFLLRYA